MVRTDHGMREKGLWVRIETQRGGWQGSVQMMNMFSLGLEEVFEPRIVIWTAECIERLGYADDLHLYGYGTTEALCNVWTVLERGMAEAGLTVQPLKSKFWSPLQT